METLVRCPVCAAQLFEKHTQCRDFTVSQEVFDIQKCLTCGFLFTNPRPEKDSIGAYYQSSNYISHTNSSKGLFNKIYQIIRKKAIEQKIALLKGFFPEKNHLRLLDVGCGTGEFLARASQIGWNVAGVEPSLDAKKQAIQNHGLAVHDENWLASASGRFDVITLWHVLEHVHELNARLEQLERLLDENGLLVIAVPNHTATDCAYFGENWAAWDVPRHLYHFSPSTIKLLLDKHGFRHLESRPMKYDAYYVSLLSTGYQSGKKSMARGFLNGWKSNRAAKGDPENYSSVIYLFKKKQEKD